jgi:uncharacterized protein
MKIAIIGATGYVGSRILGEALNRGHSVTAVVRRPDKLPSHPRLAAAKGDATEVELLTSLLAGHDVVVSAFNPGTDETGRGAHSIIEAAKRSEVRRLVVVGGAGSLETTAGGRLLDEPSFPARWREGALKTAAFLEALRAEPDLGWTFISPAAMLSPGTRTGKYRIGNDRLLTDDSGESRISLEDYALALLDEVEQPRHHQKRFTVAH